MTDEEILDGVTNCLIDRPMTFSELFANVCQLGDNGLPKLDDVDEALDILIDTNSIKIFREARHGERVHVFAFKSEARLYIICEPCGGTGFQPDRKRGLCPFCHGNGVYTPKAGEHGS